jgi:hypothetical protein
VAKEKWRGVFNLLTLSVAEYTVKKGLADSHPQPGCHLPNSPWPGIIYPVPRRFGQNKSRNLVNLFYSVASLPWAVLCMQKANNPFAKKAFRLRKLGWMKCTCIFYLLVEGEG